MSVAPITSSVSPAPAARAAAPGFNAAAVRRADPEAQRAAVASQFEAILVRQLIGPSMKGMLGGAGGGVAGSVYGDLLSDTLSQQLASGPGLGLGRMLQQQLTPRGERLPAADGADEDAAGTPKRLLS